LTDVRTEIDQRLAETDQLEKEALDSFRPELDNLIKNFDKIKTDVSSGQDTPTEQRIPILKVSIYFLEI
jgi:hypothetical protein